MERNVRIVRGAVVGAVLGLVLGCGDDSDSTAGKIPVVPGEPDPGTKIMANATLEALQELDGSAAQAADSSAAQLLGDYPAEFESDLGYDPGAASSLQSIMTAMVWDAPEAELELVEQNGFAISKGRSFPSFAFGYSEIYMNDLPVYVTADMVLEAIYRSHDKILQGIELEDLRPRLLGLLRALRSALVDQADALPPQVASDLNVYLGVPLSLLEGKNAGREPEEIRVLVEAANEAKRVVKTVLFGTARDIDFSQFKPRGHYAGNEELESYFRAMIWLGRIDLRLIETTSDGSQVLRRNQVEAMLALRDLFDDQSYQSYLTFDDTISSFVGEHDYMTLQEVEPFRDGLGKRQELEAVDDTTLAQTLIEGRYGEQRIASHVMMKDSPGGTLPLNVSFALLGQRYTVDSHVFSKVVYDRLPTRVVPNPLDVAFAALGNNQAAQLLGEELEDEAGLSGALASMRLLVDAHPDEYWQSSFYTSWLGAIRSLSPNADGNPEKLPTVARSELWGRRLLNTQLSSWAQLRHNNVLYVKQSYTSNAACEYPDAYVDPYPDFFLNVVKLAERGQRLVEQLDLEELFEEQLEDYFEAVARINGTLAEMAELQRSGLPHGEDHLAFINQAVNADINCDGTILGHTGWYSELHFDPLQAVEFDPTITDVHSDIGGELPVVRPPSVLHVGTGEPRLMIVTVDSCEGARAYAGVVSSYHESLEEGFVRLTDEEWKERLYGEPAADVSWMTPVLAGK